MGTERPEDEKLKFHRVAVATFEWDVRSDMKKLMCDWLHRNQKVIVVVDII